MVRKLTFKKWLFLFFSTLILGGLTLIITRLIVDFEGMAGVTQTLEELIFGTIFLFAQGMAFSLLSQMGFFAYLMIHRLGLGIFKSVKLWSRVQIVLIAFIFFDLVYFRYIFFGQAAGETWISYLWLPTILLLVSIPVAYIKMKQTKQMAFIPSLFFMFVATTLVSLPALMENDPIWLVLMLVTVFVCNAWQLLMLHRLNTAKNKPSA